MPLHKPFDRLLFLFYRRVDIPLERYLDARVSEYLGQAFYVKPALQRLGSEGVPQRVKGVAAMIEAARLEVAHIPFVVCPRLETLLRSGEHKIVVGIARVKLLKPL